MSWWLGIGCLAVFHIGLLGYQALKFSRKQHHEQITSRRFSCHFTLILLMYIKISISEVTLKHLRAIAVVCWTHADVSIGRIGSPRPENRKVTQMLCTSHLFPPPPHPRNIRGLCRAIAGELLQFCDDFMPRPPGTLPQICPT